MKTKLPRGINSLPEGYKSVYRIDMKHDKKLIIWINVAALIILLPFLPFIFTFFLALDDTRTSIIVLAVLIVCFVLMIVFHEGLHGVFFKLYTKSKVKYQFHGWAFSASVPGYYLYKRQFIITASAPAVVLNLILLGLCFAGGAITATAFTLLAFHFSSCFGDFYALWKIRKYPPDTLTTDIGDAMEFFVKKDSEE